MPARGEYVEKAYSVLAFIVRNPGALLVNIREGTSVSKDALSKYLLALVRLRLVTREKVKTRGPQRPGDAFAYRFNDQLKELK